MEQYWFDTANSTFIQRVRSIQNGDKWNYFATNVFLQENAPQLGLNNINVSVIVRMYLFKLLRIKGIIN